jgi:MSHA biogenesis protein MshN
VSVVNKMLRDLEARKSDSPLITADYQAPQKKWGLFWLPVIIVAVLLMAVWLWFSQARVETTEPKDKILSSAIQAQAPLASKKALVAKPMESGTGVTPANTVRQRNPVPQATRDNGDRVKTSQPEQFSGWLQTKQKVLASPIEKRPKLKNAQDGASRQAEFTINESKLVTKSASARQEILNALNDGDGTLAIDRLQQLLIREPQNIPGRKKLASLLFAQGQDKQAAKILQQGLDNHPRRSDLRLMLARLHVQQQHDEQAFSLLEGFEPSVETQGEYWAYRGALAQRLSKYTLAKKDYLQLTRSDPSKASWWLGLAIAQDRLGHKPEALEAYRKANDKDQLSAAVLTFMRRRMAALGATL